MPGPTADVLISQFFLKIDGQTPPANADMAELSRDVIEIVVDLDLNQPDMFTIHVHDKELKWVDSELLVVGKPVEISAKAGSHQEEGAEQEGLLIKGEITALEPDFSSSGEPTLVVRGYDRSHRLHRGKQTRSFLKMTDSDLVSKIAGEAGLSAQVDPTSPAYDYVLQNNQTNYEFLMGRAQRIGYQLHVEDKTLYFQKGDKDQGAGPELEWGVNLRTFRPRLTSIHQANEVMVRGWDPKSKKEIVGLASTGQLKPQVGLPESGGALAQKAFGQAKTIVVNYPIFTQAEANAMAQAVCDEISGDFIQAEGICLGDPRLKAGKKVKITGVGTRFGGDYFVTSATHTYSSKIGYETRFNVSGRQPNTLTHLLDSENGHYLDRGQLQGVVTALVTNLRDPEELGRVKVKYAWLGDNIESDWVRIAAPMAGAGRGFFYLPEVNDEVLIAFEHGDVHHPYLIGQLWNGKDKPPKQNSEVLDKDGKVAQRILKSRSGHVVILDDTGSDEKIIVRDKTGNNEMVIGSAKNSMTIKVDGDFTVEAKGKIILNSTQDMTLESKANGSVKGLQLSLEGTTTGTFKGATLNVDGSALTNIKGGVVKIN